MDIARLQKQHVELTQAMFKEGLLDDQFKQLQQLQDSSNPDFVAEVVGLYFEDSAKLLDELTKSLEQVPIDFKKVDGHVHQFKGSSSSIGARRVKDACSSMRIFCDEENGEGSSMTSQKMKDEFLLLKNRLEALLQVEQAILAAGGTIPTQH